jgi:myo-inositol-1(or 4)-monophosphatase
MPPASSGGFAELLVAQSVVSAAAALMRESREHVGTLIAKGDRDFATSVDLRIEASIRSALERELPEIPVLGEEGGGASLEGDRLWILDPIDGTVNFARGSPLCAISLAMVHHGSPVLSVVELPLLGERFVAVAGRGAFLNGRRIEVSAVDRMAEATIGVTDFAVGSDAPAENPVHVRLIEALAPRALRVRVHGSEALDLAWVACGRLDAAIMLSSRPWDVSGGVLLVREAGGVVLDSAGRRHRASSTSTVACTRGLRGELLDLMREPAVSRMRS